VRIDVRGWRVQPRRTGSHQPAVLPRPRRRRRQGGAREPRPAPHGAVDDVARRDHLVRPRRTRAGRGVGGGAGRRLTRRSLSRRAARGSSRALRRGPPSGPQ
jgi:hypothetical protein